MKVAIVHYWFITRRGGEKVVESILKLFPEADIYTLFYDKEKYGNFIENHNIYTSKYNNYFFRKYYQKLFPFYPTILKSLKLREDYDLIISSESGPAKGIKIHNNAKHVCYIHSPMRYCWGYTGEYLKSMNLLIRPIAKFFFNKLRLWDVTTINNVDLYIANSKNVANRVKKYYNRDCEIIYPPIDIKLFNKTPISLTKQDYYLSFGAITPYKRIDLLVDCFNENGKNLIIIGIGSEKKKLEKKANKNIEFKGFISNSDLPKYINSAKALIFPGEEDFGMIPLEVMSQGIPVIAYKKGGAIETVVHNEKNISKSSGLFFNEQTIKSLQNAIFTFEKIAHKFDREWIRSHAKKFNENIFLHKFNLLIQRFLHKN